MRENNVLLILGKIIAIIENPIVQECAKTAMEWLEKQKKWKNPKL